MSSLDLEHARWVDAIHTKFMKAESDDRIDFLK